MRYNVDDDWFADPTKRRKALIDRIRERPRNPEREADGCALDAWRLAARYWKDGKQLIPKDVWDRADLDAMIEADLAVVRPEGVYVRGIELRGEYLLDRKEAGALGGKASVEARKRKFGTAQPNRSKPEANASKHPEASPKLASKHPEANSFASPKQPEATPNLSKPLPPSLPPPPSLEENKREVEVGSGHPKHSPFDLAMATRWGEWAKSQSRTVKPSPKVWADVFRLLREVDGFSEAEITRVFEFVRDDSFWKDKTASVPSLRVRSKNGKLKFENALAAAKEAEGEDAPREPNWDRIFSGGPQP